MNELLVLLAAAEAAGIRLAGGNFWKLITMKLPNVVVDGVTTTIEEVTFGEGDNKRSQKRLKVTSPDGKVYRVAIARDAESKQSFAIGEFSATSSFGSIKEGTKCYRAY